MNSRQQKELHLRLKSLEEDVIYIRSNFQADPEQCAARLDDTVHRIDKIIDLIEDAGIKVPKRT